MACLATTLVACENSQTRSARLKEKAVSRAPEKGLSIGRANPDVRVSASTVLTDKVKKRSAAVVTVSNTSKRTLVAVPLVFTLTDADGKEVFSNNSPGASVDLVSIPSLGPNETLTWINDAIVNVAGARRVDARVGVSKATSPAGRPPQLKLSSLKLDRDPIDGVTATGRVINRSTIPQNRLVIFVHAKRAGKIVAAGRAVVPLLKPGSKGARFTAFLVGNPSEAKLEGQAPPVDFEAP